MHRYTHDKYVNRESTKRKNEVKKTKKREISPYRGDLHHLQLYVLWLRQASSCLRHWDVLDPLEIPLCCTVVCGQGLGKLRHGLCQQVGRLGERHKLMNIVRLHDRAPFLPSNQ